MEAIFIDHWPCLSKIFIQSKIELRTKDQIAGMCVFNQKTEKMISAYQKYRDTTIHAISWELDRRKVVADNDSIFINWPISRSLRFRRKVTLINEN